MNFNDAYSLNTPSHLPFTDTNKVPITGHSLGAALALLDAVYLPLHLPSTIQFKLVTYGMPRVGNPIFAQYVDAHFPNLTRINNKEDPVPIVPIISMGYEHPQGEVHITDAGTWESCSGNENPSGHCTVGDGLVRNVFDHDGPYNGISLGFFGTEKVTQCST
ncbi:hypothetical protein M422DRAFT_184271 [Sphaerobolus stellatus SS14]|uniref:Fungal lipase-type domain-containing protein n=1 Tax=Sphaerobolus stellatus (strain SS14) TaxID=990650 RepID=A0A0C9V5C7_SPHS4|nr:hypothetical protein M422DRAFT_184271 [Sphaerobolus stellatus SS14]